MDHEPRDKNPGPLDQLLEETVSIILIAAISGLILAYLLN